MSTITQKHDPLHAALELREQLSSHTRRFGLLLGAGTSMSVGLDGIEGLTNKVATILESDNRKAYEELRSQLGEKATVEDILSRLSLYRELLSGENTKQFDGFSFASASALTHGICSAIYQLLYIDPPKGLRPQLTLAQLIRGIQRDYPVELFTTNYDLLFERAMEEAGVPYFDGFVGAVSPFFASESVEATGELGSRNIYPPTSWARLWKLHGSIGWSLKVDNVTGEKRVTRMPSHAPEPGEELVIWPSREKYVESRKFPFMTLLDRLRNFLSSGESLLVVVGYAYQDEHILETIFQGLRANMRLAVTILSHSSFDERLQSYACNYRNLSLYSPDAACIGGTFGPWSRAIAEEGRRRGVAVLG